MNDKLRDMQSAKPYPRRCAECGRVAVQRTTISHDAEVKHDGKLHHFRVKELPVDQCGQCGEVFFTNLSSDAKAHALRQHLGLLQPEEIRAFLSQCGLTQREFGKHLRVAEESVSRWLNGLTIQSRALDTLMRVYFGFPEVRKSLSEIKLVRGSLHEDCAKDKRPRQGTPLGTTDITPDTILKTFSRSFSQATLHRRQRFQLIPSLN